MHLRVSQLHENLLKTIAESKSSVDCLFSRFLEDKWVEEKLLAIATLYQCFVKAETDRFCGTTRLIQDYYKDQANKVSNLASFPVAQITGF
jgi:hypothetical protein